MTTIYGLVDPRTQELRYVGKTTKGLKVRWLEHLRDHKREKVKARGLGHRQKWCALLERLGLQPEIFEIETVDGDGCEEEIHYIAYFKSIGCALTNKSAGGDGGNCGPLSPEHKKKLSEALKGRVVSASARSGIAAANRARVWSEESKAKSRAAKVGGTHTAETKAKVSASKKGLRFSDEHKARISKSVKKAKRASRLFALLVKSAVHHASPVNNRNGL
jgi:hypothetical protein